MGRSVSVPPYCWWRTHLRLRWVLSMILSCGWMGYASRVFHTPLLKKFFKLFGFLVSPLSVLICWRTPRTEKARRKWHLVNCTFSPAWADAKTAPEKVSMETCTYFCWLNEGKCVTSVCQSWQVYNPRGLMPAEKKGTWNDWQLAHEATIAFACSCERCNILTRAGTFWW